MTIDEQLSYLKEGTVEVIREEDLRKKLERSAKTGKPLRVKLGLDPTAPDIRVGHTGGYLSGIWVGSSFINLATWKM